MGAIVWLLAAEASLPPAGDLERFPRAWDCEEQARRCWDHAGRLRWIRGVRGHDGGWWDAALNQAEWERRYWQALCLCHDSWGLAERHRRERLRDLRALVGSVAYRAAWHPPYLPEVSDPWPKAAPARPAGPNNAGGSD